MPVGHLSRGGAGEVKLEYQLPDGKLCKLWEPMGGSILETTFDHEGGIMNQAVHRPEASIEELVSSEAKRQGLELREARFEAVRLEKSCPKCNSGPLSRHAEAFRSTNEIPVMPTYHCRGCGTRSYYLTDGYLDNLVKGNRIMFTDEELKQLDADERAFKEELKAYIIRIFASKRIMCIK